MPTATLTRRSFRESCQGAPSRVDREAGVIRGVRVLGFTSKNGRRYTPECVRKARSKYEGASVHVDHPEEPGQSRGVATKIGWLQGVHEDAGGLRGDLHLLKSHQQTAAVLEAAERNPSLFGLSHNAVGNMTADGLVESIEELESVDLVCRPATASGLFESEQRASYESLRGRVFGPGSSRRYSDPTQELLERHRSGRRLFENEGRNDAPDLGKTVKTITANELQRQLLAQISELLDDQTIGISDTITRVEQLLAEAKKAIKQAELQDAGATGAGGLPVPESIDYTGLRRRVFGLSRSPAPTSDYDRAAAQTTMGRLLLKSRNG